MSDASELIANLREVAGFQGRYPDLHRDAADALETEHAEAERLRDQLATKQAAWEVDCGHLERVEAERDAVKARLTNLEAGFKTFMRSHNEVLDEKARLTEQLQAVREWRNKYVHILSVPALYALYPLDAILDAAVDGVMTGKEKLDEFYALMADGLSESEAQGTVWPDGGK